ncbi:MAG: hypothetical protein ABIG68_10995, partial [Acidobacteriota bacterium]
YKVDTEEHDICILPMEGSPRVECPLSSEYREFQPTVSPNGRWIAYVSNRSGSLEVWVAPYLVLRGDRWRITRNGGEEPRWSEDGRTLYYHVENMMMAVPVETQREFKFGSPKLLYRSDSEVLFFYRGAQRNNYTVSPDGRILMSKRSEHAAEQINIILNWMEELKRQVKAGK